MPALMAVIGGDSKPLQKELKQVEALARQAGVNLDRSISGGSGHVKTGAMRETLVMMREMARGNWSRVPGSFSILLQQMNLLRLLVKDNSIAAQVLADAYQMEAEKAGLAAIASTQKAAAAQAALYAEGGETEANLAEAVSAERKAAADIMAAKAAQTKAAASAQDAQATLAEGAAARGSISVLGIIGGILAGIAVGATAAWKMAGALTDRLLGFKALDTVPQYIAKIHQSSGQQAETQRKINLEIERSVYLYNSAAAAAERAANVTKTHYEHRRKMLGLEKEREMARAKTPGDRYAIEAKYAQREVDLNEEERKKQLGNKITEQFNLENEAKRNQSAANSVRVNSKQHDDQLVNQAKARADQAREYIKNMTALENGQLGLVGYNEKTDRNWATEQVVRQFNKASNSGVSTADLDTAKRQNMEEAHRRIQAEKDAIDQNAQNDILRARKEELSKRAEDSAGKAAAGKLDIENQKKINAQANKNDREETAAKLAAERMKLEQIGIPQGHLTGNQRIGAYAAPGTMALVDISKKSERHLAAMLGKLDAIARGGSKGLRGGQY